MRTPKFILVVLAVPLLLSGCVWAGPALYDASRAETPLAPGRYRTVFHGETIEGKIAVAGTVTIATFDRDQPINVLLVPLALADRKIWIVQSQMPEQGEINQAIGLLERRADGWMLEQLIECGGTQDIVRAAGGTVTAGEAKGPDGQPRHVHQACEFRSTAALEGALRRILATNHPQNPLTRLGD